MNALFAHIEAKNAATRAWVAAGPKRWASELTNDVAYWATCGVTTPDELDRYLLACDVYETTKSVWGYKPSWSGLMASTVAELEADLARLIREGNEQRERAQQDRIARKLAKRREAQEHAQAVARATTREEWTLGNVFAIAGL